LLMSRLRPLVLGLGLGSPRNAEIFRGLVDSGLLDVLERRDRTEAHQFLAGHLPPELANTIPEILDGIW
jgi:precorrin-2 dehydrogenase / sirohydrochlorin ferrochelatase